MCGAGGCVDAGAVRHLRPAYPKAHAWRTDRPRARRRPCGLRLRRSPPAPRVFVELDHHRTRTGARQDQSPGPTRSPQACPAARGHGGTADAHHRTAGRHRSGPVGLTGARHQVEMVMYEDSDTQVDAALAADAHRGVAVRVLLNGGYYGRAPRRTRPPTATSRRTACRFAGRGRYFALTHQKTLIVDGRAYILTFNLTPQYYASSRDFGVIDTIAADDAAIEQTFNADGTANAITAPTGADLVWSPGSQNAQVELIESATGWVDIYNEEMDSPAIEGALEAEPTAASTSRHNDRRLLMGQRVRAAGCRRRTRPHLRRQRRAVHPRQDDSHPGQGVPRLRELLHDLDGREPRTGAHHVRRDHPRLAVAHVRRRLREGHAVRPAAARAAAAGPRRGPVSVTASYQQRYDDWDVYVHSNQPEATATVTDSSGTHASYHTDSRLRRHLSQSARERPGEKVTVHVGQATCHTTL